jgi:hypothetical protein
MLELVIAAGTSPTHTSEAELAITPPARATTFTDNPLEVF